jgi:hypothetical protein
MDTSSNMPTTYVKNSIPTNLKFLFLIFTSLTQGCMTSSYHQSARSLRNQEKSHEILLSWSSVDTSFSSESTHFKNKDRGSISFPIPFFGLSLPLSQEVDIVGKANFAYDASMYPFSPLNSMANQYFRLDGKIFLLFRKCGNFS